MLEKLSFEIQESPVLYDVNGTILTSSRHKVLSRSDNNTELSTMKNSYFPMFNRHFMETTERMREISGFEISGYSEIQNGAVVISHLKNTGEDFNIGGHKIEDYLILGSSCDGKHQFFIGTTTELIRCQNQFSRITNMEKVRHTRSAPKRVDELLRTLEVYFNERRRVYKSFERMVEYEVDEQIKEEALKYILQISNEDLLEGNLSTRKLNQAERVALAMGTEMEAVGQNLWGLFNGITKYTTHELTQKESVFGNLFGNAADLNKKAFEFSMNQLELV